MRERIFPSVIKIIVKSLDAGSAEDEKYVNRLNEKIRQGSKEEEIALKVYRRLQERRETGEQIYDDPNFCFFDDAGGVIIPSGNLNRIIDEEIEKHLR